MSRNVKTPSIPAIPQGVDKGLAEFLMAVKQQLDTMKGLGSSLNKSVTRRELENMGVDLKMLDSDTGRYDFDSIA